MSQASNLLYMGAIPIVSTAELVTYIEKLFVDGMSWDNYGPTGWHIDHIKPCASFDLTNQDEQRQCFHYTNLQPLWAADNIRKGAKMVAGSKPV